jgi:hypothetical protein
VISKRWKAAASATALGLVAFALAACGSSGDEPTTTVERPAIAAATADPLVKLSERIASDLDSGDTCHAAHAADDLSAAVQEADLPENLRPGIETVATDLVNQVNCPPPPPPPEPEKKPKKPEDEHGDDHREGPNDDHHGPGNDQGPGGKHPGHPEHGGFVPPGQAKLKGEGDG